MGTKISMVSIIMGIYNCADTLALSIESILNQTYDNWELIMCDDCSKDDTFKIAKDFEKRFPHKIKVLKNEENLTLAPTLNRCLQVATGDYIARQDGDDMSYPERLEKQVKFLQENKEYDLVATSMMTFNEKGETGVRSICVEVPTKSTLCYTVPFCHATILCEAQVYKKLGGYKVNSYTTRCEDADLWFRFFKEGFKGFNMKEPLYKVRDDDGAYKRRNLRNYFNVIRVNYNGFKMLDMPKKKYIYLTKPIIAALTPRFVMKYYHGRKMT